MSKKQRSHGEQMATRGEMHALYKTIIMLQKEVALRMLANPNSKDYSRMSVMAQTFCDIK